MPKTLAVLLLLAAPAFAGQVCITATAADLQTISTAFASRYGYQAQIPDPACTPGPEPTPPCGVVANPQTQAQFAQQQVAQFVRGVVAAYRQSQVVQIGQTLVDATPTPVVQ